MENYFNYFTEIEQQYQRRRGTIVPLSTLDWTLIETWKDAGIPLEAVLRGVDMAFDRYDQRASKTKKVNSLAYCAQEVLASAEDMKEAAVGVATEDVVGAEGVEGDVVGASACGDGEHARTTSGSNERDGRMARRVSHPFGTRRSFI